MASPLSERVQKRRKALRAAGLRPLQIWVQDARNPGFAAECRKQAARAAEADSADKDLAGFLDSAFDDIARD